MKDQVQRVKGSIVKDSVLIRKMQYMILVQKVGSTEYGYEERIPWNNSNGTVVYDRSTQAIRCQTKSYFYTIEPPPKVDLRVRRTRARAKEDGGGGVLSNLNPWPLSWFAKVQSTAHWAIHRTPCRKYLSYGIYGASRRGHEERLFFDAFRGGPPTK